MYIGLHVMYLLFLSNFNENYILSTDFRKILKTIFMKNRSVGVELFHADVRAEGLTDMTKLIDTFRNFANAPKQPMRRTRFCV